MSGDTQGPGPSDQRGDWQNTVEFTLTPNSWTRGSCIASHEPREIGVSRPWSSNTVFVSRSGRWLPTTKGWPLQGPRAPCFAPCFAARPPRQPRGGVGGFPPPAVGSTEEALPWLTIRMATASPASSTSWDSWGPKPLPFLSSQPGSALCCQQVLILKNLG